MQEKYQKMMDLRMTETEKKENAKTLYRLFTV